MPNQSQLADCLGIDRSVLPYVIDDLAEAGLVERQSDPADRRARKVVATSLGVETFRTLENEVTAAEEAALTALEPAERKQFRSLTSRLARQAGDGVGRGGRTAPAEELRAGRPVVVTRTNRILIIVTSAGEYEKVGYRTGLWLGELTHFYDVAEQAGFELTIAGARAGMFRSTRRSWPTVSSVSRAPTSVALTGNS
ncbi:MarR family winged helix-turn-helix transcriptional regulator [Streptomyces sp. PTD5-9]|uniref:MarR family winged helix-turn-helix transcriptional regulator n=1 Tax=Streptomyces sp. PTD5-9 TaxID=3120150 RepID=UPI00300B08A4